jgi:hypothetical protein
VAPIAGGAVRTVSELQDGEAVVRWSGDGGHLFLKRVEGDTIKLSRLDVVSGHKEPWKTVKVPEPGAELFGNLALSADGKACAFSFQHDLANLFLVKGLK